MTTFSRPLITLSVAALSLAMPALAFAAPAQSFSRNWAGYVASGQSYDGVHASWAVPAVAASETQAADATWVGIGGYQSSDLIQAGTLTKVQDGRAQYQAWYELLPQSMVTVPLAVSPGDDITTSITATGSSQWTIAIADSTTGKSYATTVAYSSSRSSAEWIEERPSLSNGSLVPLASFASVSFSNAGAIVNGADESYSALGAAALVMGNNAGAAAVTQSSSSPSGFTLERTSAEASDTATSSPSRRGLPQRYATTSPGWHVEVIFHGARGGRIIQEHYFEAGR